MCVYMYKCMVTVVPRATQNHCCQSNVIYTKLFVDGHCQILSSPKYCCSHVLAALGLNLSPLWGALIKEQRFGLLMIFGSPTGCQKSTFALRQNSPFSMTAAAVTTHRGPELGFPDILNSLSYLELRQPCFISVPLDQKWTFSQSFGASQGSFSAKRLFENLSWPQISSPHWLLWTPSCSIFQSVPCSPKIVDWPQRTS